MTLEVRRIVKGHDEFGKGIVVSDEKMKAVSRCLGPNISGCEIWSTNFMPVDNSWKRRQLSGPASSRNTITMRTRRHFRSFGPVRLSWTFAPPSEHRNRQQR
jgi:hypothetical protein